MAEALGLVSNVIAVIDLSVKVASRCSEYYTNVKNARDDIGRLQSEAQGLKVILDRVRSICDGTNGVRLQDPQGLRKGVEICQKQLAQLEATLEPRRINKLMSRCGIRALKWPFKSKEVDSLIKKLEICKSNISFSLQVDQEYVIAFELQIVEADNDDAYRIQILNIHQRIVLDKLRSADNAAFDSHDEEHNARCYQGTRAELLRHIDSWVSDRGSERIFWLNGMAGTGKSTISRTVAQNLVDKGELGASFFFKRGEGDRGHAGMFFATIVTQLVQKLPPLAPHVRDAIEANPGISGKTLGQQFITLVLKPLEKIQTDPQKSSSIVIVVDALDECDREEDVEAIIRLFSQAQHIASLKFFLTSRPELPIRLGFKKIGDKYKGLVLHEIPEKIVKEDISSFLEHELAIIREDYNISVPQNRQLPADWPGHAIIQSLVGMAIPLFIFATTICRFINDRKCRQPKEQLAEVLKYEGRSQVSKLGATYLPVLNQLVYKVNLSQRRGILQDFKQVVGSIVILASPLSATSLDRLLGVPEGTVDSRTDLLHSVLNIPSRPDHPEPNIDLEWNAVIQTLEGHSGSVNSIAFSADSRMLASGSGDHTIKIWDAATGTLQQTLEGHNDWVRSIAFSADSKLLASGSRDHTIKIWDAATGTLQQTLEGHSDWVNSIAFSADSKLLASGSGDHTVKIWDAATGTLQQTFEGHSGSINSVAFSTDSKLLASGSGNHTIKIWDAATGTLQQTLEGHSGSVRSIAFSADSKLLASGSRDNTIKIWDAATSTLQQTLEGHNDWVRSIAFSADSKLLVSGSGDHTIMIWDVATGTLHQTLEGHNDWVRSIDFSADSKLLASGSDDHTVKIWDVATGTLHQTLEGHNDWVRSIAFSADSKLLASGSDDHTIKIWDAATGTLQQTLEGHSDWVRSIAFSADSKLLASGSDDHTIKIWDAATGTLQQTLEGHIGARSLSFDITNSILITDTGCFRLAINTNIPLHSSSRAINNGTHRQGLSIDEFWVIWNDQNLLWLPPDFRPESFTVSHTSSKLAIGCQSGRVFIIGINNPYSNIL
ncbi:putative vegetative incompatibility protein het-e-1 protein [Botrytis cinerea BcDW1]|uniref:Putative vegetative incompatibility protein het-e-1 protein n=1 Tax=Botryotinia fuckeliana (strain BcDW1) TaxID=1290391 RepID=M7U949_BOTF1|nr:putative vegetative incompatibility protein het-e-1 protein [Botrytis cinerea BcDW1]